MKFDNSNVELIALIEGCDKNIAKNEEIMDKLWKKIKDIEKEIENERVWRDEFINALQKKVAMGG